MSDHIRYEHGEGSDAAIVTITIDRPEKRNAMTYAMLRVFIDQVARAGVDPTCRVVIITGAPGAFCAGTDLADLATIPGATRGLRGSADDEHAWWPIVSCPRPVICAIDGPAVGMGAEFASQCDVRIATTRARFAWNFSHRGLVPDTGAGSWLLPRLIGPSAALRLLYSGEFIDAEAACQLGFVDQVVEPDDLVRAATVEARRYLAGSPLSQQFIKSLVYEGLNRSHREHLIAHTEALAACFRSDDHHEGVASFLERRPAIFTGT